MENKKPNVELIESGLQCDNPKCDWYDNTIGFENYEAWINKSCPKCGENVLTEEDYLNAKILRLTANMVNSLSDEDLEALNKTMGTSTIEDLKNHPIFSETKGLENLDNNEGEVIMTVSSHKNLKIEEIKKPDAGGK